MTKLIPILSGRCLVLEMPEGAMNPTIDPRACRLCYRVNGKNDWMWIPPGNWRIIGMLSEITGRQIVDIADSVSVICTDGTEYGGWRNYVCRDDFDETILLNTALESLESSILAEGYLFENPFEGQEPSEEDFELKGRNEQEWKMIEEDRKGMRPSWKSILRSNYYDRLKDWQNKYDQAQSRVLDRSRCLLLGRED